MIAGVAVALATALGSGATADGGWRAVDRCVERRRPAGWNREEESVEPDRTRRYKR
ncbi:hypothetical protein [Streptomyces sp. NPDC006446]|uniref:hypothetical protein n=1 Tax=Streptomyces sp. NPDC006446 TaxID=3154301 RepID=UPI0033A47704